MNTPARVRDPAARRIFARAAGWRRMADDEEQLPHLIRMLAPLPTVDDEQ